MFNYLFFLSLLLASARTDNTDNCTTPINEAGQCVPVKYCSIFNDYLQNKNIKLTQEFYRYLNRSLCGFIKFESYVCCASRHISFRNAILSTTSQPAPELFSVTEQPFSSFPSTSEPPPNTEKRIDNHKNINLLDVENCGLSDSTDKVSYGNDTDLNEYPWMALLQYETANGLEFKCSGSLITRRYVLTAAHCVQTSSQLVSVRLGEHNIDTDKDCDEITGYCAPPVQDIPIEEFIIHFNYKNSNFKNDIALIRLSRYANIEIDNVNIVCLPVSENFDVMQQKQAIISGWGYTEIRNSLSNKLLQARVPLESISVCQNFYKSAIKFSNSELCAGGENKIDTCYGDSGGPLLIPAKIISKLPLFYQIGVVSAGGTKCGQSDSYTIFTNVKFFMNWILDNLKE